MNAKQITSVQIDTVTKHFLIAAVWADKPEGTNPRIPAKTAEKARAICLQFIGENAELFIDAVARHPVGSGAASFGHDLWLTSRGHGAGFWDRPELDAGKLGDKLTAACKALRGLYPEFYRGWLYLHGGTK
jgi:hypothetical protein